MPNETDTRDQRTDTRDQRAVAGSASGPGATGTRGVGQFQEETVDAPALMTPGEVAELFRVNPKTVTRWARTGKLTAIRTLGGHRRFRTEEIRRCLERQEAESHQ